MLVCVTLSLPSVSICWYVTLCRDASVLSSNRANDLVVKLLSSRSDTNSNNINFINNNSNNNNNKTVGNVYGAVIVTKSWREFSHFIWWMYNSSKPPLTWIMLITLNNVVVIIFLACWDKPSRHEDNRKKMKIANCNRLAGSEHALEWDRISPL